MTTEKACNFEWNFFLDRNWFKVCKNRNFKNWNEILTTGFELEFYPLSHLPTYPLTLLYNCFFFFFLSILLHKIIFFQCGTILANMSLLFSDVILTKYKMLWFKLFAFWFVLKISVWKRTKRNKVSPKLSLVSSHKKQVS